MKLRKQCKKRIAGVLLALAMVISSLSGLVPGSLMTAKAATDYWFQFGDVVRIAGVPNREWYAVEQDASTVTLLARKCFGECQFGSSVVASSELI